MTPSTQHYRAVKLRGQSPLGSAGGGGGRAEAGVSRRGHHRGPQGDGKLRVGAVPRCEVLSLCSLSLGEAGQGARLSVLSLTPAGPLR